MAPPGATLAQPGWAPTCRTRRPARSWPSWRVFLGIRTNNYAEWTAVEEALNEARRLGATHVDLRLDSELVARQITRPLPGQAS